MQQDCLAILEALVFQVLLEHQEPLERLVALGQLDRLEELVHRDRAVLLEQLEPLEALVLLVHLVLMVFQVPLEQLEQVVLLEEQDGLE